MAPLRPQLTYSQVASALTKSYTTYWDAGDQYDDIQSHREAGRKGELHQGFIDLPSFLQLFTLFQQKRADDIRAVASEALDASIASDGLSVDLARNEFFRGMDKFQIHAIGDLHGNAGVLMDWLDGKVDDHWKLHDPNIRLVLMGDLVDHAPFSVELLYAVMALKVVNGDQIVILKGNHENSNIQNVHEEFQAKLGWNREQTRAFLQQWSSHSPALYAAIAEAPHNSHAQLFSHTLDTAADIPAILAAAKTTKWMQVPYNFELRKEPKFDSVVESWFKELAPRDHAEAVKQPETDWWSKSGVTGTQNIGLDCGLTMTFYNSYNSPYYDSLQGLGVIGMGFGGVLALGPSYLEVFIERWGRESGFRMAQPVIGHAHEPALRDGGHTCDGLVHLLNAQFDESRSPGLKQIYLERGPEGWNTHVQIVSYAQTSPYYGGRRLR